MLKSKARQRAEPRGEPAISIIAAGMTVTGDLRAQGTIRIEGEVTGAVEAAKAVVVGREGVVDGDITTQDAVISGRVRGTLTVGSRLEVNATAQVEGEVHARRLVLEEGATLNGTVHMGQPRGAEDPTAPGHRTKRSNGSPASRESQEALAVAAD